jgi:hypothetical protein
MSDAIAVVSFMIDLLAVLMMVVVDGRRSVWRDHVRGHATVRGATGDPC